jgi:flavin-dependent dehydrogenase
VSHRLVGAERVRPIEATGDFEYRVRPLAGDGWVLIGDAGGFVDPVFSSGVHLAVTGARRAARAATAALAKGRSPRAADFSRYARTTDAAIGVYSKFIYAWYDPDFRAVFLRPLHGSFGVDRLKREVLSILGGVELPAWRALPSIYALLLLARLSRRRESTG